MSLYEFLAHLVPFGTPLGLIMLIVLIEVVRVLIRPITLSVRLAANMVAGHLLISLVCIPSLSSYPVLVGCLIGARVMIILERAVALIQAYVFSTLSSLYIRDLNASIKL
jgi:F-type H+-transporting ATPase subunit a